MVNQLIGSIVSRTEIDSLMQEELYHLFFRYYSKVDRATFSQDLAEKDWVLLLKNSSGVIQGFTTMKLYDLQYRSSRIRVIFNGNTIIDKKYWGDTALMKTWGKFMARCKCEHPDIPLYWYLICSGYRTYLFLPFFFRDFYPSNNKHTPSYESELIDTLGAMKFPLEYQDGIVKVSSPRECLQTDLAIPPERKLKNPHIKYFIDKNPGYLSGNELVCITEFSIENNLRLARTCLLQEMAENMQPNIPQVSAIDK